MKSSWCFLVLTFALQLCSGSSRYRSRPGSHHHIHHHDNHQSRFRHYVRALNDKYGRKGPLLPPPTADSQEDTSSDDTRGIKGQDHVLASLQKFLAKCDVVGSFGIKGECSKYADCGKIGQITGYKFCPSGKFFDHLKRICVKSSDARCKDICKTEGEKLADPGNPNGYLKCIKGIPMPYECKYDDEVFNEDKKDCDFTGESESEPSDEDDDDSDDEDAE